MATGRRIARPRPGEIAAPTLPDARLLRAFVAVAREGSMTAAALALDHTQSAVSQAVRQLEEQVGVVLVDRGNRPLRLTRAGMLLYRQAEPLVEALLALPSQIRSAESGQLPELRIGLIDSFAATAGPALIDSLLRTATRVAFLSGLAPAQTEALLNRQLDMIVTSESLDNLEGLERHVVFREPLVLAFPADSPWNNGAQDLRALARQALLVRFSLRSSIGSQIESYLHRLGIQAPRRLEVDTAEVQVAMVEAGLGWAITTPLCLLQAGAGRRPVRVQPLPGRRVSREIRLIARAGEHGEVARRIAATTRRILVQVVVPLLRRITPFVEADSYVVGDDER